MPLAGKLHTSGGVTITGIATKTADPVSPSNNEQWILEKNLTGEPIGLLLSLTYNGLTQYQLCQCSDNTITRTNKIYIWQTT